jgi:hypothetical protein
MFAAFDVNDRGYITPLQYDQGEAARLGFMCSISEDVIDMVNLAIALRSLGIEQPTLRLPESIEQINQSLFTRSM